ncbi:MAG TPA: excinuclease ABC subunit UvrC, partial [Candidatus Krumholzibacterium sp.]|nr:excinuclease ABC subunit UvrC [Candidatus Krumholzibacterium sp.]
MKENLGRIPDTPGVYIMKGADGGVIYVGKAKVLKNRVRSYFQSSERLDQKTRALVSSIVSIDYIATGNEVEALMLENNLIKEYRPKYNVRLKDDKRYPYLKLTVEERLPRLFMTRSVRNDGAEYFGPFSDAGAVRTTLELIKSIFPLRDCRGGEPGKGKARECLNYQIGRCLAPCTGRIGPGEYGAMVRQVRLFLKGYNRKLLRMLDARMRKLSEERRYEEASRIRDQIRAIEKLSERQHAVEPGGEDEDIVAISTEGGKGCAVVMRIREGRILGSDPFLIPDTCDGDESLVMGYFLQLYYHTATDIPPTVYVQSMPAGSDVIMEWL